MAIYPGAVFKPTTFGGEVQRNRQGRGILHVGVSRNRSYPPWSENTWHLWVALDGYCEQYVDTDFRAYGAAAANDDAIIVETAGGTGTSAQLNAEKWTPEQEARLADIMRWEASQPGGAPLELLPDARPGRRGWGPHRLGIKHSGGPRPGWWQPGSELWSNALGKECPGDAKVAQIPAIVAMARTGGDDMAEVPQTEWNQVRDQILTPRRSRVIGADGKPAAYSGPPLEYTAAAEGAAHAALRSSELARQEIAGLRAAVDKLASAAAGDELTADELRAAIREEMAGVVQVEVSVRDRTAAPDAPPAA